MHNQNYKTDQTIFVHKGLRECGNYYCGVFFDICHKMGNFFAWCFKQQKDDEEDDPQSIEECKERVDDIISSIDFKAKSCWYTIQEHDLNYNSCMREGNKQGALTQLRMKREKESIHKKWLLIYENQIRLRQNMEDASVLSEMKDHYHTSNRVLQLATKKLENLEELVDDLQDTSQEIKETTALLSAPFEPGGSIEEEEQEEEEVVLPDLPLKKESQNNNKYLVLE